MAACTGIVALADAVLKKISAKWGMPLCLVLFALTWSIPKTVYPIPYLAWLGFPSPEFVSGDYYPIIPFIFMYLEDGVRIVAKLPARIAPRLERYRTE